MIILAIDRGSPDGDRELSACALLAFYPFEYEECLQQSDRKIVESQPIPSRKTELPKSRYSLQIDTKLVPRLAYSDFCSFDLFVGFGDGS